MIAHRVPDSVRQEELSRYLKRAWPLLPGHVIRDILKKKDVRVNGVRSGKGILVNGGDTLELYGFDRYFGPQSVELLYNENGLIAAVKPQGLPSLPDADGVGADTMEQRLIALESNARLCHRLDAGTGGVMLAASTDETYEDILEVFREHRIRKSYTAVLIKKPPKAEGELHAWLFKDAKRAQVRVTDRQQRGSLEITTRYRVVKQLGRFTLVDLEPVTGRTHQLRAHMAYIGCPILGDDKYGDRDVNREAGFTAKLCLWCAYLALPDGRSFSAPAPEWIKINED